MTANFRLWDIHGGIHPPQHKNESNGTPIQPGPLADELVLPLSMHIGAPSKLIKQVGDSVLRGEKIAEAGGFVSVALHAPTSGVITAIENRPIQHPSGFEAPCIVIRSDHRDLAVEPHPVLDWQEQEPQALLRHIASMGIAGMGGAGFPSAVKLTTGNARIEQLILNAVECEPYITADDRLMRERAAQIVTGLEILRHIVKPERILIGIEDNKPEAIAAMRKAAEAHADMQVLVVPTKYPSGGEKQIIQILTGKEVPSGKLPASVGVVVQNTGTVYAIYRAICEGEPLISRITTVTGVAAGKPGNYETRIGTPVRALLQHAQCSDVISRIIMGGPMMGFTVHDANVPVVKTTNCLIATNESELPLPGAEMPCIRCGSCAQACPVSLLPQQLYWFSRHRELDKAEHHNLLDCIECGACSYVCPSEIPLVQYFRFGKAEIRRARADKEKSDRSKVRFDARNERIAREQAEKAARKAARAAARQAVASDASVDATQGMPNEALLAEAKRKTNEASSAYKQALKAAKEAEAAGAPDAAERLAQAEHLKAEADKAKAWLRDVKAGTVSAPSGAADDAVMETARAMKSRVTEASKAYKAAVKAAREAEAAGAGNCEELNAAADVAKAAADAAKAEMRAFMDANPTVNLNPKAAEPGDAQQTTSTEAPDPQKLKALKTAFNMTKKQHAEATAALAHAEKEGRDDIADLRAQIEKLAFKMEKAKLALDAEVAKARPATGDDAC